MENIRRALVICEPVVDCSDIIHYAAGMVRNMRAQLFILTLIYNPFGVKGMSLPRPSLQKELNALVEKSKKDIQAIINREKQQGILIVHHLIREGKPEKEIIATVREQNIDLLVLSAHRKTRLENLLSGGYNKELLRELPCSVLFFKKEPVAIEEEEEQEEEEQWGAGLKAG